MKRTALSTHGGIGDSAQQRAALVERDVIEAKRIDEGHAALIGQFMADGHQEHKPGREHPLFICARQRDQSRVWTSALFLTL